MELKENAEFLLALLWDLLDATDEMFGLEWSRKWLIDHGCSEKDLTALGY